MALVLFTFKEVYSFLAILLRFLIPFQCFQYQSALQLLHTIRNQESGIRNQENFIGPNGQ